MKLVGRKMNGYVLRSPFKKELIVLGKFRCFTVFSLEFLSFRSRKYSCVIGGK